MQMAERLGGESVYVATFAQQAGAHDHEMMERVDRHRQERGNTWLTLEEPVAVPELIGREARPGRALLVDCLTLWLTNLMLRGDDLSGAAIALTAALTQATGPVVLVANEVGLGIVPETRMGRAFRDAAGRLNQAVAAAAGHVLFVAAGLPLTLKPACKPPWLAYGLYTGEPHA